jgi:TonB family protein
MASLHGPIEEKYEILGRLRQGGMGAVYKARHRLLEEVRAIKVLRAYAVGGEVQERFLQEARVASRLRHPNLAVLHDFAVDDEGDAYLVSEFIDGWTLRELLRRSGPPPLSLGLEIARQSLKALGYLHRQRVVHRDISPDNLMLTRDADGLPLVKLIDLGIAKALEDGLDATAPGVFLGKPRYASPEQFGTGPVDGRSDIYSLGVVLYELFTGRCPIVGHDPLSLMAAHLNRPPLDFADSDAEGRVPSDLRELLLGALEKRPEDRIPNAEEFLQALAGVQLRYPISGEDLQSLFGVPLPVETAAVEAEPSATLYLRSPEPGAVLSGASRSSSMEEVTWTKRSPGLLYDEPVEAPRSGGQAVDGSRLLFRLALSTAALLVLFVFARGFWWPRDEARETAPEWAPAQAASPASPDLPSTETDVIEEPFPEPTLEEELSGSPAEPEVPSEPEPPMPEPENVERALLPVAAAPPRPQPAVSRREPASVPEPTSVALARRPQLWEEEPQPAGLLRPGPGVEEPVPLDFPRYSYPATARGTGLRADVRLALLVDETGRVIAARVREGAPQDLGFDETALTVARRIPFQPATRYDVPGKMWTEVILEFTE